MREEDRAEGISEGEEGKESEHGWQEGRQDTEMIGKVMQDVRRRDKLMLRTFDLIYNLCKF